MKNIKYIIEDCKNGLYTFTLYLLRKDNKDEKYVGQPLVSHFRKNKIHIHDGYGFSELNNEFLYHYFMLPKLARKIIIKMNGFNKAKTVQPPEPLFVVSREIYTDKYKMLIQDGLKPKIYIKTKE